MSQHMPTPKATPTYISLPEMTWPNPVYGNELQWQLRYAPEAITREDQLVLASICDAYHDLIWRKTNSIRNRIVSALRGHSNHPPVRGRHDIGSV